MQVAFQLKDESGHGKRFDAAASVVRIGRHPECDIRVDGPQSSAASNVHARLFLKSGEVYLEDLESSNGTFLNGIALRKAVAVHIGDSIRLGQTGPLLEVLHLSASDAPVVSKQAASVSEPATPQSVPQNATPVPIQSDNSPRQPSRTSDLLQSVIDQHNRLKSTVLVFGAIALLVLVGVVAWVQMKRPASQGQSQQHVVTGNEAYLRLMKCTVLVTKGIQADGSYFVGSGVVVETNGRILGLTNSHVVASHSDVDVHFPHYEKGSLLTDQETIVKSANRINATVIANNPKKDCAILELDRMPPECEPLQIAGLPAEPGQRIHSVGHPGVVDSAWVYTTGIVKHREFNTINFDKNKYVGWIIFAQYPINQGDSGGAMMNDDLQLVGLNMGHADGPQLISYGVSLEEIEAMIQAL